MFWRHCVSIEIFRGVKEGAQQDAVALLSKHCSKEKGAKPHGSILAASRQPKKGQNEIKQTEQML